MSINRHRRAATEADQRNASATAVGDGRAGLRQRPGSALRRHASRAGFTLLELLVVMAILMVLSGMLMPMIGQARRSSLRTLTQSIMGKTESALRQYKSDFRGYPYQLHYADVDGGEPWTNALNYQLGTAIAPEDAANVRADMQKAASDYSYICTNYLSGVGAALPIRGSVHAFTFDRGDGRTASDYARDPDSDVAPVSAWQPCLPSGDPTIYLSYDTSSYSIPKGQAVPTCVLLNRIASERASDLMMIGAIAATGVTMPAVTYAGITHPGRDLSGVPLVGSPASLGASWLGERLPSGGDRRRPSARLRHPRRLAPAAHLRRPGAPGMRALLRPDLRLRSQRRQSNALWAPSQRQEGTRALRAGHQHAHRRRRLPPGPSDLTHSDRRYWSAPGYELEFELWSAGPDGEFSWWRDDPRNKDNVSCEPYDRGIGTQP